MNILAELRARFDSALDGLVEDTTDLLDMIRPAQDPKFGDYQANVAMPLGKRLGQSPRDVAGTIVQRLDMGDLCNEPEIAGPGFINLRLKDEWIAHHLLRMAGDDRLGIQTVDRPRTFVIDYSSPNVAKPMHVGHIRSTVIGDALYRTLKFLGHRVESDNHLGDWGTQFGMIIYGYKHFLDLRALKDRPVEEFGRLYRLVNQLIDYHEGRQAMPQMRENVERLNAEVDKLLAAPATGEKTLDKKNRRTLNNLKAKVAESQAKIETIETRINVIESSAELTSLASKHSHIAQAVLEETAKLHADDVENVGIWNRAFRYGQEEISRIYERLNIEFDNWYGESTYQHDLADVVNDLIGRNLATESEGATCVFLDGFDTPMIIRKKDGAFLYATTDLATIQFRVRKWNPDAILYVVDHRQSEHFEKLFATARLWGFTDVELRHISFGTVTGKDGKPYKTRSGDTVGLEGLLDDAVAKALQVVSENDDAKPGGAELSENDRRHIANVVGHAAIKYADLAHNRTSDYVFSLDKMVAMQGNTATYMQYSFARTQSIFAKGNVDVESLRESAGPIQLGHPMERALAIQLLRFHQAIDETLEDYRPNQLTSYLFGLAKEFAKFFEQCPVLKAETDELRNSRLLLCDLTGRTIKQCLGLLGIGVVNKM